MRPTFDHTVSVLVKAYLNDELAHKTCSACAVGNIVADAIGTKPKRDDDPNHGIEFDNGEFENGMPAMRGWYDAIYQQRPFGSHIGDLQVEATGYTKDELVRIEKAFEFAPGEPQKEKGMYRGKCVDPEWMFNGLMAVVDVLAEIHNVDLQTTENARKLFVKA